MGAKQNVAVIEQLLEAQRVRDWKTYGALLTDDCVMRIAGVPRELGGVTEGKDAIKSFFENASGDTTLDVRQVIADDNNVVVIQKLAASSFPGSEIFKGSKNPYATYECVVYRLANNRVVDSTAYVNWADVYVQTGVLDIDTMLA